MKWISPRYPTSGRGIFPEISQPSGGSSASIASCFWLSESCFFVFPSTEERVARMPPCGKRSVQSGASDALRMRQHALCMLLCVYVYVCVYIYIHICMYTTTNNLSLSLYIYIIYIYIYVSPSTTYIYTNHTPVIVYGTSNINESKDESRSKNPRK